MFLRKYTNWPVFVIKSPFFLIFAGRIGPVYFPELLTHLEHLNNLQAVGKPFLRLC